MDWKPGQRGVVTVNGQTTYAVRNDDNDGWWPLRPEVLAASPYGISTTRPDPMIVFDWHDAVVELALHATLECSCEQTEALASHDRDCLVPGWDRHTGGDLGQVAGLLAVHVRKMCAVGPNPTPAEAAQALMEQEPARWTP